MLGTILIVDAMATNRILLRARLSDDHYTVLQAGTLKYALALARAKRPDLVIAAHALPDGSATALCAQIKQEPTLSGVPFLILSPTVTLNGRLAALRAGVDDVITSPNDALLPARIRSLLRGYGAADDLALSDTQLTPGFAESAAPLTGYTTGCVGLLSPGNSNAQDWQVDLRQSLPKTTRLQLLTGIGDISPQDLPDVIVLQLDSTSRDRALAVLADLRVRNCTRRATILAVTDPPDGTLAMAALDRGAHDVMQHGFDGDEMALRILRLLGRKQHRDQIRLHASRELYAAQTDALTGLANRRHALPRLEMLIATKRPVAVMLIDLDHFKGVNDSFGHLVGDAVLTETAHRLTSALGSDALVARWGGEEYLVALPNTNPTEAQITAEHLRRCIHDIGFESQGVGPGIDVSISIGLAIGQDQTAMALISRADSALYRAKNAGRNQIGLASAA